MKYLVKNTALITAVVVFLTVMLSFPVRINAAEDLNTGLYWPLGTENGITTGYGSYSGHTGADMACAEGNHVYAVTSGTARFYQAYRTINGVKTLTSYGNHVVIENGPYRTKYCHLSAFNGFDLQIPKERTSKISGSENTIFIGERHVNEGEIIGYVGTTGNSTGNHLHFELALNGNTVNPANYVSRNMSAAEHAKNENPPAPPPSSGITGFYLDVAQGGNGTVFVSGWGITPDNRDKQMDVHVYLGDKDGVHSDKCIGSVPANKYREDAGIGYHGFSGTLQTSITGTYYVWVAFIDAHGKDNPEWRNYGPITIGPASESLGDNFDAEIISVSSGKYVMSGGTNYNVYLASREASDKCFASKRVWNFAKQSDGTYKITSYYNSHCLDVANLEDKDGTNIQTFVSNDSAAQRWRIQKNGNGYWLMPACSTSRVLDINGGTVHNDFANMQLWMKNDTVAQRFYINNVTGDNVNPKITKVAPRVLDKNTIRVEIDVADDVGIRKVQVPSWSDEVGQDKDCKWHDAAQYTTGHWYCDIPISEHQNKRGVYSIDVYAWDFKGNLDAWRYENGKRTKFSFGVFKFTANANGGKLGYNNSASWTPGEKDASLIYGYSNYCHVSWLKPQRTGYKFLGWTDASSGGIQVYGTDGICKSGTKYWDKETYINWANLTVYAQWQAVENKFTYDANGGTIKVNEKEVTSNTVTLTYDKAYTGKYAFGAKKDGYVFDGWYTAAEGGTKIMSSDGSVVKGTNLFNADCKWIGTADTKVYAHWKSSSTKFTYDANGGTIVANDKEVTTYTTSLSYNTAYTGKYTFNAKRSGYIFDGWYTAAEGGTKIMSSDGSVVKGTNLFDSDSKWIGTVETKVYAHWKVSVADVSGDLDANGKLNAMDVVLLNYWMLGKLNDGSVTARNCDLNGDGKVNIADYVMLKSKVLSVK